jgi:hypothetical protein
MLQSISSARCGSSTATAVTGLAAVVPAESTAARPLRTSSRIAATNCLSTSSTHRPDGAQRMILPHPLLRRHITEDVILQLIRSAHAFFLSGSVVETRECYGTRQFSFDTLLNSELCVSAFQFREESRTMYGISDAIGQNLREMITFAEINVSTPAAKHSLLWCRIDHYVIFLLTLALTAYRTWAQNCD